jgi:hypothetical protein
MSKINLNKDGIEKLLNQFIENAIEERDLALERYRRQDEMMETPDEFILQGKFAVEYLKTASERSNAILGAAKLIKDILYQSEGNATGSGSSLSDEQKREILRQIRPQSD